MRMDELYSLLCCVVTVNGKGASSQGSDCRNISKCEARKKISFEHQ